VPSTLCLRGKFGILEIQNNDLETYEHLLLIKNKTHIKSVSTERMECVLIFNHLALTNPGYFSLVSFSIRPTPAQFPVVSTMRMTSGSSKPTWAFLPPGGQGLILSGAFDPSQRTGFGGGEVSI
jgi:hypothetical protein